MGEEELALEGHVVDRLSEGERRLFDALGGKHWVEHVERGVVVAPKVYDILARDVFVRGMEGPAVEALRRAIRHFDDGGYRGQPEFEKLIGF